jgi:iron complex transport system substrate-binding protein
MDANTVFGHPAFATTPAAAHDAFISMDGLYLLGFGPRTARAARDLATGLYPALADAVLPSSRSSLAEGCRP